MRQASAATNGAALAANAIAFRQHPRMPVPRNRPSATGTTNVLVRIASPQNIPESNALLYPLSLSVAFDASMQAVRMKAANGMSDISSAERARTTGWMAQKAVSPRAAVTLTPFSLRRNTNAAVRNPAPKLTLITAAQERFAGKLGFRRQTQDSNQG